MMDKNKALERIREIESEVKELKFHIGELDERKTWEELDHDYQNTSAPTIFKGRIYDNFRALSIIARHLQGDWEKDDLVGAWYIYYSTERNEYFLGSIKFASDLTTVYWRDHETAVEALGLWQQYLKTSK